MIITGIRAEPLDPAALVAQIRRADCGGLVVFEGSTRSPSEGKDVIRLFYEAWEERADAHLRALAEEVQRRWNVRGVVAVHRVGDVPVGEPSVLVACAAPHRAEAFEAARWLIDTIKVECPIWKKEIFARGEAWVGVD